MKFMSLISCIVNSRELYFIVPRHSTNISPEWERKERKVHLHDWEKEKSQINFHMSLSSNWKETFLIPFAQAIDSEMEDVHSVLLKPNFMRCQAGWQVYAEIILDWNLGEEEKVLEAHRYTCLKNEIKFQHSNVSTIVWNDNRTRKHTVRR